MTLPPLNFTPAEVMAMAVGLRRLDNTPWAGTDPNDVHGRRSRHPPGGGGHRVGALFPCCPDCATRTFCTPPLSSCRARRRHSVLELLGGLCLGEGSSAVEGINGMRRVKAIGGTSPAAPT
jgi:hypothetical protein